MPPPRVWCQRLQAWSGQARPRSTALELPSRYNHERVWTACGCRRIHLPQGGHRPLDPELTHVEGERAISQTWRGSCLPTPEIRKMGLGGPQTGHSCGKTTCSCSCLMSQLYHQELCLYQPGLQRPARTERRKWAWSHSCRNCVCSANKRVFRVKGSRRCLLYPLPRWKIPPCLCLPNSAFSTSNACCSHPGENRKPSMPRLSLRLHTYSQLARRDRCLA